MPRTANRCPACHAPIGDGDIICVKCGTNLLTGQKIVHETSAAATRAPVSWGPWLLGAAGVLALIAVLGGGYWYLTQDPVARALAEAREGRAMAGINILQEYTANRPGDAKAAHLLGKLYWQAGQYDKAAAAFDSVAELEPAHPEASLLAAGAWFQSGMPDAAARQRESLERHVRANPNDPKAWRALATARGAAANYPGQLEALDRADALGAADAYSRLLRGTAQALSGDPSAAEETLSAAAEKDAPNILAARGIVASMLGSPDAAEDFLAQAVAKGGSAIDVAAGERLGLIYMSEGRFQEAMELLRKAKDDRRPSNPANLLYAMSLQAAGMDDPALVEYDRIAAADGPNASEAALQMALIHSKRGDLERAQEFIRRAQSLGNSSARLFTIQGQIYTTQGDMLQAQEAFRNAINRDGSYAPAHLEAGLYYIQRGVLYEGVTELEKYLELAAGAPPSARLTEVELLLNQIKQTLERGGDGQAVASR